MPDSYTTVTRQSWFSRIGDSIKGILVGLVLFLVAFPLLFWNEGRAVQRQKTLEEGAASLVSVEAGAVIPDHEGALIHVTGTADTEATLTDPAFGVSVPAIRLRRTVEMYQWQEEKDTDTKKKVGGATETTTTYRYGKTWAENPIDSSSFDTPAGHENPSQMAYRSQEWTADRVTLGAFDLPPSLVARISRSIPVEAPQAGEVPDTVGLSLTPYAGGFFAGADPSNPAVGDLRIAWEAVKPTEVSVIARQTGDTLSPFQARAGGTIELLEMGTVSSEEMIQRAEASNRTLTWLLRLAGFALMGIGLGLILKPLSVLADVLPVLGNIVGAGTGLVAFLVALTLSAATIAVAWVVYRPVLGIILLAFAALFGFLAFRKVRAARPAVPAAEG